MAELKTKKTAASAAKFLASIEDPKTRKDSRTIASLMAAATGAKAKMWGTSIVGFGDHHYEYASGREGDWFVMGFSPRKSALTLYLMSGLARHAATLAKLGKHKTGKGCLYIRSLDDVDAGALRKLIRDAATRRRA